MEKFWIVWNPEAERPPKKKYASKKAADTVAAAMAKRFGGEFYTLGAVGVVRFGI